MNCRNRSTIFIALFVISQLTFGATSDDILVPVVGTEKARVETEGRYFLEQMRYVSKRIRIVKINPNALLDERDSIVISPFPDVSVSLNRTELRVRNNGIGFVWEGVYAGLPETKSETLKGLSARGFDSVAADRLYDSLFSVSITGAKYAYDEESGRSESLSAMKVDSSGLLVSALDMHRLKPEQSQNDFFEILVDLRPPPIKNATDDITQSSEIGTYQIRSLPTDRRYHVVFEIDPEKALPTGKKDAHADPVAMEKIRKFREFKETLGPNPLSEGGEESR